MRKFLNTNYLFFDNDNDPFIPELWAQESLAILEENMVMGNLVHRNFEDEIASFGDVVNTRKPREFESKRKIDSEDVTTQDAIADNVAIPLNQHIHVSFLIKDGEESKSFKNLVEVYLRPALLANARFIDQVVAGQLSRFAFDNFAGKLGTAPTKDTLLDTRKVLNDNKAWVQGRNLVLSSDSETSLLKVDEFTKVNEVGELAALREAALGRKFQFDIYMDQNMSSVSTGSDLTTATTVNDAAANKGDTTIVVTSAAAMSVGEFFICTDGTLHLITDISTNTLTIWPGLSADVANASACRSTKKYAVNQNSSDKANGGDGTTAGYRAGWHKGIAYDGNTLAVEVGQIVVFGAPTTAAAAAAAPKYTIVQVGSSNFLLDRPPEAAIADNAVIGLSPKGNYNFGFHRNAVALVTRPLVQPRQGAGALSGVASYNGLSIRVVITYDGKAQGHRVTVDMLAGVQVLDKDLGVVMFG
jgi:hypothetical protein